MQQSLATYSQNLVYELLVALFDEVTPIYYNPKLLKRKRQPEPATGLFGQEESKPTFNQIAPYFYAEGLFPDHRDRLCFFLIESDLGVEIVPGSPSDFKAGLPNAKVYQLPEIAAADIHHHLAPGGLACIKELSLAAAEPVSKPDDAFMTTIRKRIPDLNADLAKYTEEARLWQLGQDQSPEYHSRLLLAAKKARNTYFLAERAEGKNKEFAPQALHYLNGLVQYHELQFKRFSSATMLSVIDCLRVIIALAKYLGKAAPNQPLQINDFLIFCAGIGKSANSKQYIAAVSSLKKELLNDSVFVADALEPSSISFFKKEAVLPAPQFQTLWNKLLVSL